MITNWFEAHQLSTLFANSYCIWYIVLGVLLLLRIHVQKWVRQLVSGQKCVRPKVLWQIFRTRPTKSTFNFVRVTKHTMCATHAFLNLDCHVFLPHRILFGTSLPVHIPTTRPWVTGIFSSVQLSREFAFKLRIQDSVRHKRGNPWRQKFPPYWTPENPQPTPVKVWKKWAQT